MPIRTEKADGTVYAGWGWWLAGAPDDADGGLIAFRLDEGEGRGDTAGDSDDGGLAAGGGSDASAGSAGDGHDDDATGEHVYQRSCASCHGGTGEGSSGPSLVDVDERLSRDEQLDVVRLGRGSMPGWEDDLTAEEIEAVVDYQRTVLARGDGD